MGRPPLGTSKRSETVTLHVTAADKAAIRARGGTAWATKTILNALRATPRAPRVTPAPPEPPIANATPPTPPIPTPETPQPPDPTTTPTPNTRLGRHLHKRQETGHYYVSGTRYAIHKCADCGQPLD